MKTSIVYIHTKHDSRSYDEVELFLNESQMKLTRDIIHINSGLVITPTENGVVFKEDNLTTDRINEKIETIKDYISDKKRRFEEFKEFEIINAKK